MALVPCHECGYSVSTEAKACPQCGAAPKKHKSKAWLYALVGAPVILFTWVAVGAPGSRSGPENKMEKAIDDCRYMMRQEATPDASIKQACEFLERDYRARTGREY